MTWKKIGKSSYTLSIPKFPHWSPKYPFAIPYEGNKPIYNIGNDFAYASNPRFTVNPTGVPITPFHDPCGYWWRNYQPPFTMIFTSLLYPVLVLDSMEGVVHLIDGDFKSVLATYTYSESINTTLLNISEIEFKTIIQKYNWAENIETTSIDFIEGEFKEVFHRYSIPVESIETVSTSISTGKHWVVIKYLNWPVESIEATDIELVEGYHESVD